MNVARSLVHKVTGGPKAAPVEDIRIAAEEVDEVEPYSAEAEGASTAVDDSNAGRLRSRAAELRAQRTGKGKGKGKAEPGQGASESDASGSNTEGSRKKAGGGKSAAARKRKVNKK